MKLFMFYIGGDVNKANNIELHDVRFSVGETYKDCYDDLRKQWWGDPDSLHLDSWSEIEHIDGYDVTLSKEKFIGPEKLFFMNAGGYFNGVFEEVHKNLLVVDENPHKAILKVLKSLKNDNWVMPHRDNLFQIDNVICVNDSMAKTGLHIHLKKSDTPKPFEFTSQYIRLG